MMTDGRTGSVYRYFAESESVSDKDKDRRVSVQSIQASFTLADTPTTGSKGISRPPVSSFVNNFFLGLIWRH